MNEITFKLDDEQLVVFGDIGALFAMAEVDADQAIVDFARAVDPDSTGSASYPIWNAGIEVVKQSYAVKKGVAVDSDTVKSMVKRFYARLNEKFGLTKPVSPETGSQKKAEQRTKAQLAMDELKAKPIAELQDEISMLTAKATPENLAKAGKLAKAIKEKNRDALKDRMAGIKELQKEVIQAVKDCLDESLLQDALHTLEQYQPEEATI